MELQLNSCLIKKVFSFNVLLFFPFILFLFFLNFSQLNSQTDTTANLLRIEAPKVFINCPECDFNFIKNEISFVNYVNHPNEADISILITSQVTGSGGEEFTLVFDGNYKNKFYKDTIKIITQMNSSEDDKRKELIKYIKLGIIPYISSSPVANNLTITYEKPVVTVNPIDYWDNWVFSVRGNAFLSGEKSLNSESLYGSLAVDRITEEWKLNVSFSLNYSENNYLIDTTWTKLMTRSKNFNLLVVKSLDSHLSVGIYGNLSQSSYSNIKFGASVYPAIEYNFYPYSLSTSRQLSLMYKAGYKYNRYFDSTIYDKIIDNLALEELSLAYTIKEKWGSIGTSIGYSNYFQDFKKMNLNISANVDLFLFSGLSIDLWGIFSMIHDQIYLQKEDASEADIISRRIALLTTFNYYFSLGFKYSFGSIYNNIVNPRFER